MIDLISIGNDLNKIVNFDEFDSWYSKVEDDLINFFYKKNATDFENLNFHCFYFDDFFNSTVYQEYHTTKISSNKFIYFLNIISIACEKLALIGNNSILISLINDLPDSSNKYRLLAINEFSELDDIKTGYFKSLPKILVYLDKSLIEFEDGSERLVLDIIIAFYNKAKNAFSNNNLDSLLIELKQKLSNDDLLETYPILKNILIEDLINDKNSFTLSVNDYNRDCLESSIIIKNAFSEINNEYFNHPRINHNSNNLWGFNKEYIINNVLKRGRADFTSDSGEITAKDKVLLYCFFNFKKHYFTTYAVFETVINSLSHFFNNDSFAPTFIDLGCGPMTSGLALADLINKTHCKPISFSYIGIDISEPMIDRAKTFHCLEIFSNNCDFYYYNNWGKIESEKIYSRGVNNPIIFNASYLFASDSVDPIDLAKTVNDYAKQIKNVYFIFQNPSHIDKNIKYVEFKEHINFTIIKINQEVIKYKAASTISQEEVYYEILKIVPL